ncbi:MAG: 4-(cytidine 5'-diphospho)-2-C-methyl-D-erythritol kinase [Hyphomonadaceae bacterium]
MSVRVFAPAKINLTLEVGAPRPDGYHPLQSAVVFAGEGDWIEAAAADALTLEIIGPFSGALESSDDNLVLRAARLLDPRRGAALKLEKNLPIASGIGGGSSDAAATLIALNELWSLGRSVEDLARLSAALGTDVAVCVYRRSAWMSGVGDKVQPMQCPMLDAVLVNPGKPLATPPVYRRFDELELGKAFTDRAPPVWMTRSEAVAEATHFGNDLIVPAVSLMAELGGLIEVLRTDRRSLYASLSGSGATCFAITENADDARALAAELSARNRDWWVRSTTLASA